MGDRKPSQIYFLSRCLPPPSPLPLPHLLGSALEVADEQDDPLVLLPEVVVEGAVDNGIEAAVEVRHEVADHEEPLGDAGRHVGRIDGHRQADQVERRPADGEEHKDHKHGDKIPQVAGPDARGLLRLHFTTHLRDTG